MIYSGTPHYNLKDCLVTSFFYCQLLILVDIFSESFTTTSTGVQVVPINNLLWMKGDNLIIHVTSHVQRLAKKMEENGLSSGKNSVKDITYDFLIRSADFGPHSELPT